MVPAFGQTVQEDVLVTGSLIRGAAQVGVPVTNLGAQDYAVRGALTTSELFATIPQAQLDFPQGTSSKRGLQRANFRGLSTNSAVRSLLMVDGMRVPPQAQGNDAQDPSIIPQLAIERLDILVDGAGATYGSDAISAVINEVLKRGYDGATTRLQVAKSGLNEWKFSASQNWGRTWDGGDIALTYEWYTDTPAKGQPHSNTTVNFTPWGLDDRTAYTTSVPGIVSSGPATFNNFLTGTQQFGTSCTNCFSIPHGTGADWTPGATLLGPSVNSTNPAGGGGGNGSFASISWANLTNPANFGALNEHNLYEYGWFTPWQERNAAVLTTDQRLTPHIWAFVDAFYDHRASRAGDRQAGRTFVVPTWNPYYPVGAPNTTRPLTVAYNLGVEWPTEGHEEEVAARYTLGLNFKDLPFGWSGRAYYAYTYTSTISHNPNSSNAAAVSAALGWTIQPRALGGTTPPTGSWVKPANVPYLNVFCDPEMYQCNSLMTLNYMTSMYNISPEYYKVNEKGIDLNGPLFDLPAGQVKGAIAATYTSYHAEYGGYGTDGNTMATTLTQDFRSRQVWAYYGELNIPVFGEMANFPLFQKLDLSVSYRYDHYSDVGGTTNPKVMFNWQPFGSGIGFQVKGGWGTSFRAPGFTETSTVSNAGISAYNIPSTLPDFGGSSSATTNFVQGPGGVSCTSGPSVTPPVGSGAYKLNPTCSTAAYGYSNYVQAIGLEIQGGAIQAAPIYGGVPMHVGPEVATNWSIGFDWAPTDFLSGLDLQATYYVLRISDFLTNFQTPNSNLFNDPTSGFHFYTSGDLGGTTAFQNVVLQLLTSPYTSLNPLYYTNVLWINDGTSLNKGVLKLMGVDFQGSYDWDMGDLGAWNAGITGTFYLHRYFTAVPGLTETVDQVHNDWSKLNSPDIDSGSTAPSLRWNARLGWSDGPWSVTFFTNYIGHYNSSQNAPPNVNCGVSNGCTLNHVNAANPAWYTFDLAFGYNTGDDPENDYLKHIQLNLNVNNIMDRLPPFQYRVGTGGGNPTAFDLLKPNTGRAISVTVTKQW